MSTTNDDESGGAGAERRDISSTRRYVKNVRAEYYSQLNNGGVDGATHHDLCTAVLRYWDVLHEFDEDIEEFWKDNNLDAIPRLAEEQVVDTQASPGYGASTSQTRKPKLAALTPGTLVELTHRLDRAAKELGFAASPTEGTTRTEITEEEIDEFQEWAEETIQSNSDGGIEDVE